VYTQPAELRDELTAKFGQFPLFRFWGPAADITSSRWISDAALHILRTRQPTLTLVYLPHLDYDLQRLGPDLENKRLLQDLRQVDALCGELIAEAEATGRRVIVLSEYGITKVDDAVHINRALREAGFLKVREELGTELLDAGSSDAFAVVDHQLAHIYVQKEQILEDVRTLVSGLDGVERVLGAGDKVEAGLDHPRAGELVAVSRADRWFSYYYWLDVERAPDFASTVDIHRKPGYDPVELFLDPELFAPNLSIAWRLVKKGLGMRTLMDVISPDAVKLVKGSHGRLTDRPERGPLFLSDQPHLVQGDGVASTDVMRLILSHLFDD
jgi:predicted AlkP superfamily pyrophosphatase or phosphodiesterase